MWFEHFIVGALQMRCTVVTNPENGSTIIIDGGAEPERIIEWIDRGEGRGPDWSSGEVEGLEREVVALVNTHAHFDHSGHIPDLKDHYRVDWWLHPDDEFLQSLAQDSGRRWGFDVPSPARRDCDLEHGMELDFSGIKIKVIHTPGHTLGGCCLLIETSQGPNHLIAGDTIFAGSVGRTDLPNSGGDFDLLSNMIRERLFTLNEDVIIHPGHGPLTTIGREKRTNPFVGGHH